MNTSPLSKSKRSENTFDREVSKDEKNRRPTANLSNVEDFEDEDMFDISNLDDEYKDTHEESCKDDVCEV